MVNKEQQTVHRYLDNIMLVSFELTC